MEEIETSLEDATLDSIVKIQVSPLRVKRGGKKIKKHLCEEDGHEPTCTRISPVNSPPSTPQRRNCTSRGPINNRATRTHTHTRTRTHSPKKLNDSAVTAETAEAEDSVLDMSIENEISKEAISLLSNDLIVNAFHQVNDFAARVYDPSLAEADDEQPENMDLDSLPMDDEEPGHILSTANSHYDQPFDEDPGEGRGRPRITKGNNADAENLSAIARMRFQKTVVMSGRSKNRDRSAAGTKHNEEIPKKEKHEKWRKQGKREEAQAQTQAPSPQRRHKRKDSIPEVEEWGLFDTIAKPLADVLNQSQALFFDVIMGKTKEELSVSGSSGDDNSSGASSYYTDDEESTHCSRSEVSRGSRSEVSKGSSEAALEKAGNPSKPSRPSILKTGRREILKKSSSKRDADNENDPRIIWDGDSESDDEDDGDGIENYSSAKPWAGGANRSFLDVSTHARGRPMLSVSFISRFELTFIFLFSRTLRVMGSILSGIAPSWDRHLKLQGKFVLIFKYLIRRVVKD